MEKKIYLKANITINEISLEDIILVSDPNAPETDIDAGWDVFD